MTLGESRGWCGADRKHDQAGLERVNSTVTKTNLSFEWYMKNDYKCVTFEESTKEGFGERCAVSSDPGDRGK